MMLALARWAPRPAPTLRLAVALIGAVSAARAQTPAQDQPAPPPSDLPAAQSAVQGAAQPSLQPGTADAVAERPWTIVPWASLDESVTDNARLLPSPRTGDLITAASAGLGASGRTRRTVGSLEADATYDKYVRATDMDGFLYNVYGNGTAEVLDRYLFVDARSAIDTQSLGPNGPSAAAQHTLPTNQLRVYNNSFSPYLNHDFGTWANAELRYRLSTADFSGADVGQIPAQGLPASLAIPLPGNTVTNEYRAEVKSGQRFTRLRWDLMGDILNTSYIGADRTIGGRTTTLEADYAVIRQVAVVGELGYDTFRDSGIPDGTSNYPSWRTGLRLTPGPRTSLTVLGGQRFGGPYWSGRLEYQISPKLRLSGSHDITVTTEQQQLNTTLNDMVTNPTGQLVNPVTALASSANQQPFAYVSQSYLLQTSQVTLTGDLGRTGVTVDVFNQVRDLGVVNLAQTPVETQQAIGFDGLVTFTLTPAASIHLGVSAARLFDSVPDQGNTAETAGLSYDYKLSPTLTAVLSYRYDLITNQLGTGYQDNIGVVGLRKEF